jgi:hypothetical protein
MEAPPSRPRATIPSGFRDQSQPEEKRIEKSSTGNQDPVDVVAVDLIWKIGTGWSTSDGMVAACTFTGNHVSF